MKTLCSQVLSLLTLPRANTNMQLISKYIAFEVRGDFLLINLYGLSCLASHRFACVRHEFLSHTTMRFTVHTVSRIVNSNE